MNIEHMNPLEHRTTCSYQSFHQKEVFTKWLLSRTQLAGGVN